MSVSISGDGSVTGIDQGLNVVGVVTATQIRVGSAVTIHSGGFQVGSSDIHSTGIAVNRINIGTGASISSPATNVLTLGTNNSERVRIGSTGSVGIGTNESYGDSNASFTSLSLGGNGTRYGLIELNKSDGIAGSWIDCYGTGGNGDLRITTAGTSGAITFWTGGEFTEKVRINSAGLVGINSQSPTALLDICDTTSATGLGIKKTDGLIYFARSTGYSYATSFSERNSFIGRADNAGNHITSNDGGLESSANQMVIGHNGTGGILLGTTDAGPFPSGRMLIDADGRIRTPNQISFAQYSMSGTTFNSGTMSGGNSDHNVGGHYNTSTGIFTAPVTGYYQFGCGVLVETGTGRLEGSIAKNNSGVLNFNGTGTTYDGPTATCILYLSVNDNVRIRRISGTAHGSHGNCYFWGRLLG